MRYINTDLQAIFEYVKLQASRVGTVIGKIRKEISNKAFIAQFFFLTKPNTCIWTPLSVFQKKKNMVDWSSSGNIAGGHILPKYLNMINPLVTISTLH